MKRLLISFILAVALLVVPVSGALAAPNDTVTVTATPAFVSISNDLDWVINDVAGAGSKTIVPDTIYYSNPLGDTTAPQSTVADGDCRFTVTNTSTVVTNIVVNFPDPVAGDSTNSDLGTNDTTKFGAFGYVSGVALASKVILKATGSDNLISDLAATTDFKWGIMYESQSDAWTSGDAMVSTVTIVATAS